MSAEALLKELGFVPVPRDVGKSCALKAQQNA